MQATSRKPGVTTLWLRVPTARGRVIYEANPPQAEFHAAPDKYRWLVGGVGGGKSVCGCVEAILTAMEYPGSQGLIGRWAFRELMATTWKTLKGIIPQRLIVAETESSQKAYIDILAPNSQISRIWAWPLSNVNAIHSLEVDWWYVDETDKIPANKAEDMWSALTARLRGTVGPRRGWATGNPNGRDWLWKKFVHPQHALRDHKYVLSPTRWNIANLEGDYEARLRRENSKEWTARFLDAQFNEFEGSVYWNYQEGVHVFEPFPIPPHWPLFLGMDWGLSDPCAALLLTTNETGEIFVVAEYYRANRLLSDQCKEIRSMIAQARPDFRLDWAVIDPSAARRDQASGLNLLDQYREGGLPVTEANNRLHAGVALVQQALNVDPDRLNPITGKLGAPRLFISSRCPNLREQLINYRWGPDSKPLKGEDHAVDALRYAIARNPHAAEPQCRLKPMIPSAKAFWDSLASDEGWRNELPRIGSGARGMTV